MKNLLLFLCLFSGLQLSATIINIPADQPSIQMGISAAANGDTVLVQPGTYYENINYNGKNISVASLFLTTQDTTYISQTIIDGNQNDSVVTFENGEDSTTVLCGFTITNGNANDGGGIYCYASNPVLKDLIIINNSVTYYGGGIYCCYSDLILQNLKIYNNSATMDGGGIYYFHSNLNLKNISIIQNYASQYGGGICLNDWSNNSITNFDPDDRCSIYSNSSGEGIGNDYYVTDYNLIHVIVDTFSVFNSSDYFTYPRDNFSFDILNTVQNNLLNVDLYVSPNGDDNNSGLNANEPFKTIQHALNRIYANEQNPHTINLLPGTYSPQTNEESYPVYLMNYVSLEGFGVSETILDANSSGNVFKLNHINNSNIKDMTITGGFGSKGGGIYCYYSDPTLQNLIISENNATQSGGGIYCTHSNPNLINMNISNNSADSGGGICCRDSSNMLCDDVVITENTADNGGGFLCHYSNPLINNVMITNNTANDGGGIYIYRSDPSLVNSLISYNNASEGGGIYCRELINLNLINMTISNNSASEEGSGIYCRQYGVNLNLVNCILWDNPNGQIVCYQYSGGNSATLAYTNIQAGQVGLIFYNNPIYWLEGNFSQYPNFLGSGEHPFSLTEFSPCINAGIPDTAGLNLPELDLAENPRIYNEIIDMGCYEYQENPFAPEFEADTTIGLSPLEVHFTDLSTGSIIYWGWDFENDGITDSNEQHPIFIYNNPGLYTVSLTISSGPYAVTETKINYITVGNELIADFEADIVSGLSPLEVQFTDLSIGGFSDSKDKRKNLNEKPQTNDLREITNWEWDFDNDGTTDSNEQNPIYIYIQSGVYTVSLTVSDGTNFDTEIKYDYIEVTETGSEYNVLTLENKLIGNHPNPFNPSTVISFNLTAKDAKNAKIEIYNLKGQKIKQLVSHQLSAGRHSVIWQGDDDSGNPVSSGIYYYKLIVNGKTEAVKKCLLLK